MGWVEAYLRGIKNLNKMREIIKMVRRLFRRYFTVRNVWQLIKGLILSALLESVIAWYFYLIIAPIVRDEDENLYILKKSNDVSRFEIIGPLYFTPNPEFETVRSTVRELSYWIFGLGRRKEYNSEHIDMLTFANTFREIVALG